MEDTNPIFVKSCSKCGENKNIDKFIANRNICKVCKNAQSKERYNSVIQENVSKECNVCIIVKPITYFIKSRNVCKDCNNAKRCLIYQNDENHRLKLIQLSIDYKRDKAIKKHMEKKLIQDEIGIDNKKCKYCNIIYCKTNFRNNRLKCKDCEKNDPNDKFKRTVRTRIYNALKKKNKHTIEYLGCSSENYINWMLYNNDGYTLENHGKEWHIDHVIPLSKFNLDDCEEQLIAFNWRNTTPLKSSENLSKNNKIISSQIERHIKQLLQYHALLKIELPQCFKDLFAKYLVAGSPLEPLLPLAYGNICKELG